MNPNFLIIGAAKSGTTSLYQCLSQHPEIYMTPVKETNFFSFEGEQLEFTGMKHNESSLSYQKEIITNLQEYQEQFEGKTEEKAVGESCPSYLYVPKAAERIYAFNPNIKLIVVLRDPIERAYSNFLHHVRDRNEWTRDFLSAVKAESKRIEENWWWGFHYIQVGLYSKQLKRYFNLFNREQIKIYLYKDYLNKPEYVLKDICKFLEVDRKHTFDFNIKHNATGLAKYNFLDKIIKEQNALKTAYQKLLPFTKLRKEITKRISRLNFLGKPQLDLETRNLLLPLFHEDILSVQELIERDLTFWLN